MNVLQRARESGKCPPSLLLAEQGSSISNEAFETALAKVLDANGAYVRRRWEFGKMGMLPVMWLAVSYLLRMLLV